MKKLSLAAAAALFLLSVCIVPSASAGEAAGGEGRIVLPWEEFRKALNLDEEKIVLPMETFQKLLAQTGVATAPAHSVSGGNVVLTRADFKKLVDAMKPPAGAGLQPPVNYLVTKALYSGRMNRDNSAFTGTFTVHVLRKDTYLKIPLLHQSIALEDIRVDGKQALVVTEGGFHNVVLSRAGEYAVTASFSLRSALDRGPRKLDLFVQPTPITLLELEIPLPDIAVQIPQAQQLRSESGPGKTLVRAIVSPGNHIAVQWQKKVPAADKIPPKLYSELYHLVSIEDDVLKVTSEISYNILHSEVEEVRIAIPENMNILAVSGEGVGDWQEIEREGSRLLRVPFTYGKKGRTAVLVTAEKPLSESGAGNAFTGFQTPGVVRESGFLGIALNTSAELIVADIEVLERVAPQKLPPQLINKSAKPLMLGFKYLKHPYLLVLDVKKHEKVAVPVATIDSASVVTLFTEDGKVVHRLIYQVRNSAKQFLEVELPEGADVWGVFVDNHPVESSISGGESKEGRTLLVPLIRSRAADRQLATFPVEVVMALSEKRFAWFGAMRSSLPAVDLLTSQIIWSVYLPHYYGYHYFNSSLEKEEIIRGVNIFSAAQRTYDKKVVDSLEVSNEELGADELRRAYRGKEAESTFRNVPMEQSQVVGQMRAEMDFNGRMGYFDRHDVPQSAAGGPATGVLPITVRVPTSGQVYRFARTIINRDDPLTFSVVYTQLWISRLVKWGLFLLALLFVFRNRTRITGRLRESYRLISVYRQKKTRTSEEKSGYSQEP